MNDADLSEAQLSEARAALLQLRDELELQRERVRVESAPVAPDDAIGRLSRMDAMQQAQMAKANELSAGLRLRLVHRALEQMDQGEFGLCRSCEETIEWARLRARPESPMCLRCQSAREGA